MAPVAIKYGPIKRGFTAFEALLAAAILAFLTAAVSGALMAGRQQSKLARDTVYASTLAHALMDEVMRLPITDPQGYTTLGPDPGETRPTFNCVKDYNGFTDGPNNVADIAANLFPSVYQNYVRTVAVQPVSYTPTNWGRTMNALQVTVTVSRDGQQLINLQAQRVQLMGCDVLREMRQMGTGRHAAGGFTLFEFVLVVLVVAIAAAILVPVGTNLYSPRLRSAANVLASDIEFCASECITRPGTPRAIVFDTTNNKYTVQDSTSGVAIAHPADAQPFVNDFATGRNAQLAGVLITGVQMGSGTLNVLTFDAYGRPLITADMVITLAYNGATLTVTVKQITGDVTIP